MLYLKVIPIELTVMKRREFGDAMSFFSIMITKIRVMNHVTVI